VFRRLEFELSAVSQPAAIPQAMHVASTVIVLNFIILSGLFKIFLSNVVNQFTISIERQFARVVPDQCV